MNISNNDIEAFQALAKQAVALTEARNATNSRTLTAEENQAALRAAMDWPEVRGNALAVTRIVEAIRRIN